MAESRTCPSPPSAVSRDTVGQLAVSTTARAARVRSTSQAAPDSSSRAVVWGGAEDGGEFGDAEAVADGEFEGLALFGGGSGGLGPGEAGEFGAAVGVRVGAVEVSGRGVCGLCGV
ncbi:hypothetical protein GCM10020254_39110 [Streptomyces goshikiensis]